MINFIFVVIEDLTFFEFSFLIDFRRLKVNSLKCIYC